MSLPPAPITRQDVEQARARIAGRARVTPLLEVTGELSGVASLKLEFLQHTGSFKARGALNHQLAALESHSLDPTVGVIAASGGNAGLAHAFAARALGLPATVFVPETVSAVKLAGLRTYGARVRLVGREYAEAYEAAVVESERTGALFCHAYDQPGVIAGAGGVAAELLEQSVGSGPDAVVVSVGGGGLLAGTLAALPDDVAVVAVEPALAPTFQAAVHAGHPVDVEVGGCAANSLGARRIGEHLQAALPDERVHSVLVGEDDIREARSWLWRTRRIAVEEGAACALAAVLTGQVPSGLTRVSVILCGANTDPSDLTDTGDRSSR